MMELHFYSDGACRPNPGIGASSYIIHDPNKDKIIHAGYKILKKATNNIAEFEGILLALRKAKEYKDMRVRIFSDSRLVIACIRGIYKTGRGNFLRYIAEARRILENLSNVRLFHVPRENRLISICDKMCSYALKNVDSFARNSNRFGKKLSRAESRSIGSIVSRLTRAGHMDVGIGSLDPTQNQNRMTNLFGESGRDTRANGGRVGSYGVSGGTQYPESQSVSRGIGENSKRGEIIQMLNLFIQDSKDNNFILDDYEAYLSSLLSSAYQ